MVKRAQERQRDDGLCYSCNGAQALTLSQLIAVLEVRNVTGAPEASGKKLCEALRTSMDFAPTNVTLYEATATESPLFSSSDG